MQFEEVLGLSDPKEDLRQLVDPKLGDNYPLDSVFKVGNQFSQKCLNNLKVRQTNICFFISKK